MVSASKLNRAEMNAKSFVPYMEKDPGSRHLHIPRKHRRNASNASLPPRKENRLLGHYV